MSAQKITVDKIVDSIILQPGETYELALQRRVRMHEFMATGGQPTGYANGKMVYSEPVDPFTTPDCPFHTGLDCIAWTEIREGRGYWTKMEAELAALEEAFETSEDPEAASILDVQIVTLREKLEFRPRSLAVTRDRSKAEIEEDRLNFEAKRIARQQNIDLNLAMRVAREMQDRPASTIRPGVNTEYKSKRRATPSSKPERNWWDKETLPEDARDTASDALRDAAEVPDEIVIDGEEED